MIKSEIEKRGLIFDIQRYSLHDGPGIRTVVFFKGCPLRCKWCANPESLNNNPQLYYNKKDCIGCQRCVKACTQDALAFKKDQIIIDIQKCSLLFNCVKVCPTGALNQNGEWYTVKQVIEIALKDAHFYKNSGGGITLSGGEVLNQSEFAEKLLKTAKENGLHTAIETSGYSEWKDFLRVLTYTDLVLYDIKHVDEKAHKYYTGVSNKLILENLKKTVKTGIELVARIPIIPSVNAGKESIKAYIDLLTSLGIKKANILPFHQLGVAKYEMIGLPYTFKDEKTPTNEFMSGIKKRMQDVGIEVKIGG